MNSYPHPPLDLTKVYATAMEPKKRGRPRKILTTESAYHLTYTLGNEVYQSEAPTLLQALQALPKPQKIMIKSKLVLTQGEKQKEWLYMPMMAKRLFYPLSQPAMAKTMLFGF